METSGIKLKDKIGYALGDVGNQLTFGLVGPFLQMFYTDILGIKIKQIARLMLVIRIWDGINDPMWGSIIDRRKNTPRGRFRPFLLWVSVPLAVSCVLMFTDFGFQSAATNLVYAYITYIAFEILYTAINISYGALASVVTSDPKEQSDLSTFRSVGSGLGSLPAAVILPMFVFTEVNQNGIKYNYLNEKTFLYAVIVLCFASVFVNFTSYKMTVERVKRPAASKDYHFFQSIASLRHNRPFIVICIVSMLLIAVALYTMSVNNYLFKDYFKRPALYSAYTVINGAPMLLMLPFLGKLVRKYGKKEICSVGIAFSAAASFLIFFFKTTNPYVYLVYCAVNGLGQSFLTMQIWAFVTDVIDYQELLTGKRDEGTTYSFFSLTRKIGHTLAGAGGVALLDVIGYQVTERGQLPPVQLPQVGEKMYDIATLLPAIALLLTVLSLWFLYPLGKKSLAVMKDDLQLRREQEAVQANAEA